MILFLSAIAALFTAGSIARAQGTVTKPNTNGYVSANGVDYWFEIRGKGEPLPLLHGGLMSTEAFGPVLTTLAETKRIIGIDLLMISERHRFLPPRYCDF